MSLSSLFTGSSRRAPVQTRNPAAPRPDLLERFAAELQNLAARAPQKVRPAAQRAAASPGLVAAGLGVLVVGAGLALATNKRTRAGMAALVGTAVGLASKRTSGGGFGRARRWI